MENNKYQIKRKKRRLHKKVLTALLFAFVFLLWCIYYLLQSDLLNLKYIEINGNNYLQENEIIEISGLTVNRNIYKYNLAEIEENIEVHPYVEEAYLKRKFPNSITITINEREEYVIIPYMGSYIYLDPNMTVLKIADSYITNEQMLVTGVEILSFTAGETVKAANLELLKNAFEVLDAAEEVSVKQMITEINISEKNNIKLITFDNNEVLLGKGKDPVYLMTALKEVLINLYSNKLNNMIIDMRYEGSITAKSKNNQEEE